MQKEFASSSFAACKDLVLIKHDAVIYVKYCKYS